MKRLLYLLFAAVTATACTPAVLAGEFRIVGKIENVPDSAVVLLYESQGRILREIAVDTLVNGEFSLQDTVSAPKIVQVNVEGEGYSNWLLDVWVAPGECVKITGKDNMIGLWDILSRIPEQQEENNYRNQFIPEMREMMLLTVSGKALSDQEYTLYKELLGRMSQKTIRYMQTAPVTQVWMNKLAESARLLQMGIGVDSKSEMLAVSTRMSDAQRQSPMGRQIEGYLNPAPTVSVGDLMVDGDLYDVDGNVHHLAEFAGKYILLDFWSQGCTPCVWAIPELKEIAERYSNRIGVVSINQDPELAWKEYVTGKKLTGNQWNELLDGNTGLGAIYQVNGIPHFVLIAPDGRIQDVWQGYGKGSLLEKIAQNMK